MNPTPTATSERILSLDVVRGAALFGILLMNMPGFSSSYYVGANGEWQWDSTWDRLIDTVRDVLCSGKFNGIFSMLFAVGFTLQLQRLQQRDPSHAVSVYCRRLVWLLVFGLIHSCVFWTGDVLHMYALLGFVLLALRHTSDRVIVALIIASMLYSPLLATVRIFTVSLDDAYALQAFYQKWETSNNLAYGHGTFLQAAREHTLETLSTYAAPENLPFAIGFYAQLLTTMLIGLLVGRHLVFQRAHALQPQLQSVQSVALVIGVLSGLAYGTFELAGNRDMLPNAGNVLSDICYTVCRLSLMTFYVTLLLRACHDGRWRVLLERLALVGRMPLTNYLGQTLLGTFIFYGWGLGWWNEVSPFGNLVLACALFFGVQIPLTAWWLEFHEQGPMEYAWRWLTYGPNGMRRASADAVGKVT